MRAKEHVNGLRQCSSCKEWKPINAFAKDKVIADGLSTACRPCISARNRKNRHKTRYGITRDAFDNLVKKQNGVCAICGKAETSSVYGVVKELALDHCHQTGRIRGALCLRCNNGLGRFLHDPELLRAAAQYLEISH